MPYNSDIHHRHSIRLRRYDYSQAGAYFVTICTHNKECLFGDIADDKIRLNKAGHVVGNEWIKTAEIRNEIQLDEWVIMPNHFHGILITTGRGTACRAPTHGHRHNPTNNGTELVAGARRGDRPVAPTMPKGPKPESIGAVMAGFKSAVTKQINKLRHTPGAPLWQRNYWEHIIRNESELNEIRQYINNNPAQWELDRLYHA